MEKAEKASNAELFDVNLTLYSCFQVKLHDKISHYFFLFTTAVPAWIYTKLSI